MNDIIKKLKKLSSKTQLSGDIPIAAIVTKNNKIISKEYNKKYKNYSPFDHAEILSIKKACKKLKTLNLSDCELYVTLEPCRMCKELIKETKIKKVYYFSDNNKIINNKTIYKKIDFDNGYFSDVIKIFFINKR